MYNMYLAKNVWRTQRYISEHVQYIYQSIEVAFFTGHAMSVLLTQSTFLNVCNMYQTFEIVNLVSSTNCEYICPRKQRLTDTKVHCEYIMCNMYQSIWMCPSLATRRTSGGHKGAFLYNMYLAKNVWLAQRYISEHVQHVPIYGDDVLHWPREKRLSDTGTFLNMYNMYQTVHMVVFIAHSKIVSLTQRYILSAICVL